MLPRKLFGLHSDIGPPKPLAGQGCQPREGGEACLRLVHFAANFCCARMPAFMRADSHAASEISLCICTYPKKKIEEGKKGRPLPLSLASVRLGWPSCGEQGNALWRGAS